MRSNRGLEQKGAGRQQPPQREGGCRRRCVQEGGLSRPRLASEEPEGVGSIELWVVVGVSGQLEQRRQLEAPLRQPNCQSNPLSNCEPSTDPGLEWELEGLAAELQAVAASDR